MDVEGHRDMKLLEAVEQEFACHPAWARDQARHRARLTNIYLKRLVRKASSNASTCSPTAISYLITPRVSPKKRA